MAEQFKATKHISQQCKPKQHTQTNISTLHSIIVPMYNKTQHTTPAEQNQAKQNQDKTSVGKNKTGKAKYKTDKEKII